MDHYDESDLPAVTAVVGAIQQMGGQGRGMRQDAGIFVAQQLNYVRTRVLQANRVEMAVWSMVPRTNEVPAWAESVTTKVFSEVGMAKIISNYADDLPRADVKGEEITTTVKDVGDSYGYSVSELRASEALGANLPTRKANAAFRAVDIKMARLAMVGEAQYKLYGLLTHPNIGSTVIVGNWGTASADSILNDMNTVVNAVVNQSKSVHRANRIAMSLSSFTLIQNKIVPDSGGKSVLAIFQQNNPSVTVMGAPELDGAGSGGSNVMIASEFSSDNFSFEIPMAFTQLPAQARNLELVVPCVARAAGLQVYYPLALTKAEGM